MKSNVHNNNQKEQRVKGKKYKRDIDSEEGRLCVWWERKMSEIENGNELFGSGEKNIVILSVGLNMFFFYQVISV